MTRLGLTVEPSSCPPHAPSGGLSFPGYRMASRQSVHLQFVRSRYGQATRTAVYHAISPMISVAPCSYLTNLLTHHRRHDARLMSSWHILRSPSLLSGSQLSRLTIPCASSIWSAHSHPRHSRHGQHNHHAHGNHHPSIRERLRHSRLQHLAEVEPTSASHRTAAIWSPTLHILGVVHARLSTCEKLARMIGTGGMVKPDGNSAR